MMISVIIPTHDPHPGRLRRTLDALQAQTLPRDVWELVLVDNASFRPLIGAVDVAWHPAGRIVREERLGLTPARIAGLTATRGGAVVFVDDDNVLAPDYLEEIAAVLERWPNLGAFGGRNVAEYETAPPPWFQEIHGPLAVGEHGDRPLVGDWSEESVGRTYPIFSPVGAGLCLRREVAHAWMAAIVNDPVRRSFDRRGTSLASGGDNDIILTALAEGWQVGYFPELRLTHLIPSERLTADYHARLLEASGRTWVVVLGLHGIRPWPALPPWTLALRRLRAWLRLRPWSGTVARLRWRAACGNFAGRADLYRLDQSRLTECAAQPQRESALQ